MVLAGHIIIDTVCAYRQGNNESQQDLFVAASGFHVFVDAMCSQTCPFLTSSISGGHSAQMNSLLDSVMSYLGVFSILTLCFNLSDTCHM